MSPYYESDGVTIYCGDSLELVGELGSFDLLLTDPPYGLGENVERGRSRETGGLGSWQTRCIESENEDWDKKLGLRDLDRLFETSEYQVVFGGNHYDLSMPPSWLLWDKCNSGDFADAEMAWTNLPGAVRLFKWRWNGMLQELGGKDKEERVHPTQKPLAVMRWCIEQAREKSKAKIERILDPFMGSGTTLVAARELGIEVVGIEQSERYCEVAVKRLSQGVLPLYGT